MYLLITVAGYIDALPTIGLVMLTAVIGVSLLKQQGLETLTRGTQKMRQGQLPAQELAEGLLLAVAGALLITPGFVTDVVGFLILFPPTRVLIASMLLSRVHAQGLARLFRRSSTQRCQPQIGKFLPDSRPKALKTPRVALLCSPR